MNIKYLACIVSHFIFAITPVQAGIFEKNGNVASIIATIHEKHPINSLAFSSDGNLLAVAKYSYDFSAQVWDWAESKRIGPEFRFDEINNLNSNAVQFSSDGKEVIWCGYIAATWRYLDGVETYRQNGNVPGNSCVAIAYVPGRNIVWILQMSYQRHMQTLVAYDAKTWKVIEQLEGRRFLPSVFSASHSGRYAAIAGRFFSDDVNDRGLLTSSQRIRIFDLVERRQIAEFPLQTSVLEWRNGEISALAWSADENSLAVGFSGVANDGDDVLQILDSKTGQKLSREAGPKGTYVSGLLYTPDRKYLIASGISRTVKIWDENHTRLLQEISVDPSALAVSADGHYLALGGESIGLGSISGLLALMAPPSGKVLIYRLK